MGSEQVLLAKRVGRPPKMNGRLGDRIWRTCSVFDEFEGTCADREHDVGTSCYLCFDSNHLYVGWRCEEDHIDQLECWHTETIGNKILRPLAGVGYSTPRIISKDDYVHIIVDPTHDKKTYYELLINPLGKTYTGRGVGTKYELESDPSWKCEGLHIRTHIGKNVWSVEAAIPFASLGIRTIEKGSVFGINLRRQRAPVLGVYELSRKAFAWSTQQTTSPVFIPEHFGVLIFGSLKDNIRRQLSLVAADMTHSPALEVKKSVASLRKKANMTKTLSLARWLKLSGEIEQLKELIYWRRFKGLNFVIWRCTEKARDELGLVPPLPRPPSRSTHLKRLSVSVEQDGCSRMSVYVTNVSLKKQIWRTKVGHVTDSEGNTVEPRMVGVIAADAGAIHSQETRAVHLVVDSQGAIPGRYEGAIDICGEKIGLQISVLEKRQQLLSRQFAASHRWRVPKICGSDFWMMLDPIWCQPGLKDLDFVKESGMSISPMSLYTYFQKMFQVAARELQVYSPYSNVNMAKHGTVIASGGTDEDASRLTDGDLEKAGIFASAQYPIEGWFGVEFPSSLAEVGKLVIHHGVPFNKRILGKKVPLLNVAKDFVVQRWNNGQWMDIPGTRIKDNHSAVTTIEFQPVVTRRLRVYVYSQSFSGIRYSQDEAWKWWVEHGDAITRNDPRRFDVLTVTDVIREGVPFEDRLSKKPFSVEDLLIPYGKCLVNYDKTEEKKAYASLKSRFKDNFLGFQIHEWDSSLWHLATGVYGHLNWDNFPDVLLELTTDRYKAHDEIKRLFGLLGQSAYCNFFASNCYKCVDHYALEWGARYACIQLTQSGNPSYQTQIAFARGAARQYRRMWIVYLALYLGPSHPYPDAPDRHLGMTSTVATGGCSPSAYYRTMIVCYMAGCSLMYHENHILSRTFFNRRQGRFRLAPHGKAVQAFHRFAKRHSDRGVPYTPVGILLDYMHGWSVPYVTGKGVGVGSGRVVWLNSPYGKGDNMINEFMKLIFPWCRQRRERMGHYLTNSPYGDIFDVLVPNPPSGIIDEQILSSYKCLVLLGDIIIDSVLSQRLIRYAEQGGVLVVNKIHLRSFDGRIRPEQVLMKDKTGRSFAAVMSVGKGRVIVTSPPYLNARKNHIHPMTADLMKKVIEEALPVTVVGDVEYLLNKRKTHWVVTLVNNRGVYKEPATREVIRVEEKAIVDLYCNRVIGQANEWIGNVRLPIRRRGNGSLVRLEVPPGEVRIVELDNSIGEEKGLETHS